MATHLLLREYYSYFNERRIRDAADLFARDAVIDHAPFGKTQNGGEGYVQFAELWIRAFPDGRLLIEHVEQRGDTICEVDLISTGTHQGDLDMGAYGLFKATGVKAFLRCRELLEIRGGKITYSSLTFDVHDLVRQLSTTQG